MASPEPSGSNLLDALRPEDRTLLAPYLRDVSYEAGHILYRPGDDVTHCYFPRHDAIASFMVALASGSVVETTVVGREGAVGGIVSHGKLPAFARACVMHKGSFYRISSADLQRIKDTSPAVAMLFVRYADCMVAQFLQSGACNATHTILQRSAKWMLSTMDRTGLDRIAMTQDQLGAVLGVGRSYVSRVLRKLKDISVVEVRRGVIVVNDRAQLEALSCECSAQVARHFETVLRGVYPSPDDANGNPDPE